MYTTPALSMPNGLFRHDDSRRVIPNADDFYRMLMEFADVPMGKSDATNIISSIPKVLPVTTLPGEHCCGSGSNGMMVDYPDQPCVCGIVYMCSSTVVMENGELATKDAYLPLVSPKRARALIPRIRLVSAVDVEGGHDDDTQVRIAISNSDGCFILFDAIDEYRTARGAHSAITRCKLYARYFPTTPGGKVKLSHVLSPLWKALASLIDGESATIHTTNENTGKDNLRLLIEAVMNEMYYECLGFMPAYIHNPQGEAETHKLPAVLLMRERERISACDEDDEDHVVALYGAIVPYDGCWTHSRPIAFNPKRVPDGPMLTITTHTKRTAPNNAIVINCKILQAFVSLIGKDSARIRTPPIIFTERVKAKDIHTW